MESITRSIVHLNCHRLDYAASSVMKPLNLGNYKDQKTKDLME